MKANLGRAQQRYAAVTIAVPAIGTACAIALLMARGGWSPATPWLLIGFYLMTTIGVEVGFHRYFSHRSFKCGPRFRTMLGAFGSMAGQGPVLYWVAIHRDHHGHTDTVRDPHAPLTRNWRGFWRSHIGWLLEAYEPDIARLAPDLVKDAPTMRLHRAYIFWFVGGLILPAAIGGFLGGGIGAIEGFLWGGLTRIFLNQHVTWSINSLCHRYGSRAFVTRDESRNLAWLAVPTLGGSWHNNHHANPGSATNDVRWWQLDIGAWFIRAGAALGLVWDVRDGGHRSTPHARRNRAGG